MRITIPGTLPSLNEIVNASKASKYVYVKMKDFALNQVKWSAIKTPPITALSDFVITWYMPNKRKDKDNIMAGQKFIFDGLQECGILENDGWKQIGDITHKFRVDKNNPRVEVTILPSESESA